MINYLSYELPSYRNVIQSGSVVDLSLLIGLDEGSPATFLSRFINVFLFPLAAIVLFVYLLWGGLSYMLSSGNPDKTKAAWAQITQALIGFVIIFTSWWLIQLVEVIFGINILGG